LHPASGVGGLIAHVFESDKVYYINGLYGIMASHENFYEDESVPKMKISQKGLYGLQAMMMLARHHKQGAIKIRQIAYEENLPEKFLELILLELKNARMVESVRGAKGGYQLRRDPSEIRLSEIMRLIDGPLAPFGDAEQLRSLINRDDSHRALYQLFLDVRDAAANILENTSLADLIAEPGPRGKGKKTAKKKEKASILPMVVGGAEK
jgi:Rrf2 family protein